MFNLYANTTSPDSFLGLVAKKANPYTEEFENNNRKILSGFAIASLLILSLIANGSHAQVNFAPQNSTATSSYTQVI